MFSVWEAGTYELFGPERGAQYNRISGGSEALRRRSCKARRMTRKQAPWDSTCKVGAEIVKTHYNGAHEK